MAPQISPDYASPNLRLGLLLHDHPNASYTFELKSGKELGLPVEFGGAGNFCLASIDFGDGRSPATAWKPVPSKGGPEDWNVLCTKAMGRALKKAGYPDDLKELKALVLWRQRSAEIEAISSGTQQVAIASSSGGPQAAIGAGSTAAAPAPDLLEQALTEAATSSSDDDVAVPEIMGDDDAVQELTELIAGLGKRELATFHKFLDALPAPHDPAEMNAQQITDAMLWMDPAGD